MPSVKGEANGFRSTAWCQRSTHGKPGSHQRPHEHSGKAQANKERQLVFREPQGKAHHTVSHTHPQKEHTQRHQGEQPQKKILPFTASKVASSRNGMHLFNLI